jgi:hypothetical protein
LLALNLLIIAVMIPHSPSDLRDVGGAAIFGAALAEEALQVDFGALALARGDAAAAAAASGKQRRRDDEEAPHFTAVPAMARTICFWNRM